MKADVLKKPDGMKAMRILIVEDEIRLAQALAQIMTEQKFFVDVVHNGEDGLYYAANGDYEVIVLDVMLPKLSGFDVVRKLREQKIAVPVLLLTAKDEISDKVHGLNQGADDYMTKPFSPEELLARVRALSRRQGEVILDERHFEDLTLNLSTNVLHCKEKSLPLGHKEREVMRILLSAGGKIVPKEELIVKVWGSESDVEENNVEAYISFLRKKLRYLSSGVQIFTVRKAGYRLGGDAHD